VGVAVIAVAAKSALCIGNEEYDLSLYSFNVNFCCSSEQCEKYYNQTQTVGNISQIAATVTLFKPTSGRQTVYFICTTNPKPVWQIDYALRKTIYYYKLPVFPVLVR